VAEAVKLGFANLAHIKADPNLDSLRDDPAFKKVLEGLKSPGRDTPGKPGG